MAAGTTVAVATFGTVLASDGAINPPAQPWSHNGMLSAFDAASLRRGHQVYVQVCASCHGLARIAYRNMIGVMYSEGEMKAIAEDTDVRRRLLFSPRAASGWRSRSPRPRPLHARRPDADGSRDRRSTRVR